MPSQRALAGVTHDIAHHAESGVCYVCPHLYGACCAVGIREATVDLLEFARAWSLPAAAFSPQLRASGLGRERSLVTW